MAIAFASTLKPSMPSSLSLSRSVQSRRNPSLVIVSRMSSPAANGNFYEMLSLSPSSASGDDVKQAFRSLALRYHPDVCDPSADRKESTRMFVMLHKAYRTLSDPVLREEYDYNLGLGMGGISGKNGQPGSDGNRAKTTTRWREQLAELKRRSVRHRGETWGSIMRARNKNYNSGY